MHWLRGSHAALVCVQHAAPAVPHGSGGGPASGGALDAVGAGFCVSVPDREEHAATSNTPAMATPRSSMPPV